MRDNDVDLCGFAPASLRKPLTAQTDRTRLSVPGDYATVQHAIDAVAPGGTIVVGAGSHAGGFTVWKPVMIQGAGLESTVLAPREGGKRLMSILHDAEIVTLEALTVAGTAGTGIDTNASLRLGGVKVTGHSVIGVSVRSATQVDLQDVLVVENEGSGVVLVGLSLESELTLSNTTISNNRSGILGFGGEFNISDSTISNNREGGIHLSGDVQVEIVNSSISQNQGDGFRHDLSFGDDTFINITQSSLMSNEGNGLMILKSDGQVRLLETTVSDNGEDGIFVNGDARLELVDSTISNNRVNRLLLSSSAPSELSGVTFADNRNHGVQVNGAQGVTLRDVTIENNRLGGLCAHGDVQLDVSAATISSNERDGVLLRGAAVLTLADSTIADNNAWGMAVYLESCGFTESDFSGEIALLSQ